MNDEETRTGVDLSFLIFAHARSGSDNLCAALDRHPRIKVCNEPFNPNYRLWDEANVDYRAEVVDEVSLYAQLRRVQTSFTAIKTLDLHLPRALNEALLRDEGIPLVLMRRKNALQAVVSHWLARNTHIWQVWAVTGQVSNHYRDLPPAPIETIGSAFRDFFKAIDETDRAVSQRTPSSFIRIWYEDLYTGSESQRAHTFTKLTRFLGCSDLEYDQVEDILGPRGKLNSAYTYSCIPNASELNNTFGSDETGWLFDS